MFSQASQTIRFRGFKPLLRGDLLHGLGEFARLVRPLTQSPFRFGIGRGVGKFLVLMRP
jgi:hypothetical protein